MQTESVVLFSGGLDSVAVAAVLANAGHRIHFLCCDLGKPLVVDYAEQVAIALVAKAKVSYTFESVDLSSVYDLIRGQSGSKAHMPGYRMMHALVAMSYADKLGLCTVYSGECYSNFSYNFATAEHDYDLKAFDKMLGITKPNREATQHTFDKLADLWRWAYHPEDGNFYSFSYETPLYFYTKPDRIRLCKVLGVPLELTFTCVGALEKLSSNQTLVPLHCGRASCYFCVQRQMAFRVAKVEDPTRYQEQEPLPLEAETFIQQQMR